MTIFMKKTIILNVFLGKFLGIKKKDQSKIVMWRNMYFMKTITG